MTSVLSSILSSVLGTSVDTPEEEMNQYQATELQTEHRGPYLSSQNSTECRGLRQQESKSTVHQTAALVCCERFQHLHQRDRFTGTILELAGTAL